MPTKPQIFEIITNYFANKPIRRVQVFGSYARNQHTADSDIDILVTLSQPIGLFAFMQYQLDLEKLLHIKVDLGTPESLSPYLWKNVVKDLETIYERFD